MDFSGISKLIERFNFIELLVSIFFVLAFVLVPHMNYLAHFVLPLDSITQWLTLIFCVIGTYLLILLLKTALSWALKLCCYIRKKLNEEETLISNINTLPDLAEYILYHMVITDNRIHTYQESNYELKQAINTLDRYRWIERATLNSNNCKVIFTKHFFIKVKKLYTKGLILQRYKEV